MVSLPVTPEGASPEWPWCAHVLSKDRVLLDQITDWANELLGEPCKNDPGCAWTYHKRIISFNPCQLSIKFRDKANYDLFMLTWKL